MIDYEALYKELMALAREVHGNVDKIERAATAIMQEKNRLEYKEKQKRKEALKKAGCYPKERELPF